MKGPHMQTADIMDFIVQNKFWIAVAVPFVIAVIVIKIMG